MFGQYRWILPGRVLQAVNEVLDGSVGVIAWIENGVLRQDARISGAQHP